MLLFQKFLKNAAKELRIERKTANKDVTDYLQTLPWKGNVRQLDNVSRWLMVMATGHEITRDDLPEELVEPKKSRKISWESLLQQHIQQRLDNGETQILNQLTPLFEGIALRTALEKTSGKKKEAADLLGWGRNTLARKMKEMN